MTGRARRGKALEVVPERLRRFVLLLLLALAVSGAACEGKPTPAPQPPPAPAAPAADPSASTAAPSASAPHRQPKPGERVRQPELDAYCEGESVVAFYYHGGNPTTRVARNDRCTPLFLSECEAEGRCYPPRDQEPGMWCCAPRGGESPAVHAAR